MTDFARAKPAGWAVNEKVTSTQMNAIDTNVSNALNRTGGNISGAVTVSATGSITWGNSAIGAVTGSGYINVGNSGSAVATGADGALNIIGGGILTVGRTGGAGTGTLYIGTNGRVTMDTGGIMAVSGTGQIQLADGANLKLMSTATTFPAIDTGSSLKTRTVMMATAELMGYGGSTSQTADGWSLSTTAAAGSGILYLTDFPLHHGATLTQVDVYFVYPTGHASLPTTLLAAAMTRRAIATGAAPAARSIMQSNGAPTELLAALNDGKVRVLSLTGLSNNVIDTTQYVYEIQIQPEGGGGALAGTVVHAVKFTYTVGTLGFA